VVQNSSRKSIQLTEVPEICYPKWNLLAIKISPSEIQVRGILYLWMHSLDKIATGRPGVALHPIVVVATIDSVARHLIGHQNRG
jgi:hypothetical protein